MSKTLEMPIGTKEEPLKPVEVPAPALQTALTIADLKAMSDELAKELNEMYEEPLKMKAEAEKLFQANGVRQAELLEAFYQKTGVKFQPAFKEKFTVNVII